MMQDEPLLDLYSKSPDDFIIKLAVRILKHVYEKKNMIARVSHNFAQMWLQKNSLLFILNFQLSYRKNYNSFAIHFNECRYTFEGL